jgi:hypothetical protein
MARKELDIHFYAKALLVAIPLPYAIWYAAFYLETTIWGKLIALLFLALIEYTFVTLVIKEYKNYKGIRPKYKPSKPSGQSKPFKKKD